jgi:putative oxidoreductase
MVFFNLVGESMNLVSLLLRLVTGGLFMAHGFAKLKAGRHAGDWLKNYGVPTGFGLFAGVVEFFGGIALLLGFLTPVVAPLFAIWMVALIWLSVAKLKKKLLGGYEFDILLLVAALAIAVIGAGAFSLDYLLGV